MSLQQFADEVFADGKKRGKTLIIGTIQSEIKLDYESKGFFLESEEVVIDDGTLLKYKVNTKEKKEAVIDNSRFAEVVEVVNNPAHIYEDTNQRDIVYVGTRDYATGKVLKIVIHPNYKKKGKVFNYAKSIGVVNEREMNHPQFRIIK